MKTEDECTQQAVELLRTPTASLLLFASVPQIPSFYIETGWMPHTIDFAVYRPWEFTAVIVVFALEMIGAFGSTSPPPNPLTLSFVSSKKSTRNEVNDEEEGMQRMGNKQAGRKILRNVNATTHFS